MLSRILKIAVLSLIKAYQYFISPMFGNNCRFFPSCSEYSIEAIKTHGIFKGVILSFYRILRCHPFSKGGVDEVSK